MAKNRFALAREVIETCVLAGLVAVQGWNLRETINQGRTLSAHATMLNVNADRLMTIESRGSRSLEAHEKMDDQREYDLQKRVEKLETAIMMLQPMPTKMEAMVESQKRIEAAITKHTDQISK